MEIVRDAFRLRPWRAGDEPSLVLHANNPNVSRYLRDRFPFPYTDASARDWIGLAGARPANTTFAIVIDGAAVGGIAIERRDDVYRRSAELGYWLGEVFWGRGIMTDAVRAVTEHAFATFDLCRIFAGVFEGNVASARVLERAGYVLEGRLRKSVCKDGRMLDELLYASVR